MNELFASVDLVARIEAAECGLLTDCIASTAARHPDIPTWTRSIGGGVATLVDESSSPINKVAGVGFAGPLDDAELDDLEALYFAQGTAVQVELSTLADPSVAPLLTRRGYLLVGFENVMGRRLVSGSPPVLAPDVEISPSPIEELNVWLDAVVTGFAHPEQQGVPPHEEFSAQILRQVIEDMASAPRFSRFLARRQGQPAGGASLRCSEGVAQLCGAATVPAHRRRGVQAGLLATRLHAAAAAGCDLAVVTTQPGSGSQHNVERRGFSLLYARAILRRDPS